MIDREFEHRQICEFCGGVAAPSLFADDQGRHHICQTCGRRCRVIEVMDETARFTSATYERIRDHFDRLQRFAEGFAQGVVWPVCRQCDDDLDLFGSSGETAREYGICAKCYAGNVMSHTYPVVMISIDEQRGDLLVLARETRRGWRFAVDLKGVE